MLESPNWKLLDKIRNNALKIDHAEHKKVVIFSDLHLGNGSRKDDAKHNKKLLESVFNNYSENNWSLILNGDIEELGKFNLKKIISEWKILYSIIDEFKNDNRLFKIVGNHDEQLLYHKPSYYKYDVYRALNIEIPDDDIPIFVLHGDRAQSKYVGFNWVINFLLKYIVSPLGIKNRSVAYRNRKKFKVEKSLYNYSASRNVVTIIGHTHRPLFESYSLIDSLRFKLEELLRNYRVVNDSNIQLTIKNRILELKKKICNIENGSRKDDLASSRYSTSVPLPALFNSGCTIGKRGISSLEIENGEMRLVHWFDQNICDKYLTMKDGPPLLNIEGTSYWKSELRKESLNYIMDANKLLR